jgi:hypothetical protein
MEEHKKRGDEPLPRTPGGLFPDASQWKGPKIGARKTAQNFICSNCGERRSFEIPEGDDAGREFYCRKCDKRLTGSDAVDEDWNPYPKTVWSARTAGLWGDESIGIADAYEDLMDIKNKALFDSITSGDWHDAWGTAMGWHFALADWITDHGGTVPSSWGFRQGAGGSDTDAYEYQEIDACDPTVEEAIEAGNALEKVEEQLKQEGRDY